MLQQAPPIDTRTRDEIVNSVQTWVCQHTDWRPRADGGPDAGQALMRIFGHLSELVIARLNQTLEKNFLAFLDMIGTQMLPPQPARVPLTFHLAAAATVEAHVPAYTQAAALPTTDAEAEVIYETERALTMTPAQLNAVFVHTPDTDQYRDNTAPATGVIDTAFPAFCGKNAIEHSLYLAHDDFFMLPAPKTVTLRLESPQADQLSKLDIVWSYWNGAAWQQLAAESSKVEPPAQPPVQQWQVVLNNLPPPTPTTIDGLAAGWLQARLQSPLPSEALCMKQITASVEMTHTKLMPDLGFANTIPLDLSKDFYPFGEKPRLGDTLYLAHQEAFAGGRSTTVTIKITLSNPLPPSKSDATASAPEDNHSPVLSNPLPPLESDATLPSGPLPMPVSGDAKLAWEVWNGQAWQVLTFKPPAPETPGSTSNGAQDLTQSGKVCFDLPPDAVSYRVNGKTNYWVRARIASGSYGHEAYYTKNQEGGYDLVPDTYAPPLIQELRITYTYAASGALAACRAYNDFTYIDHTEAARSGTTSFCPFPPTTEKRCALYLGFDRPFANRPMTLYLDVEPSLYNAGGDADRSAATATPAYVSWAYAGPSGWKDLGVTDETHNLTERGLLTFIGPVDFTSRPAFGLERYWLRARLEHGCFAAPPYLRRVLTNTTWASQAMTIHGEILGSSNGTPGQVFRTSKAPVLPGPTIEVRELTQTAEPPALDETERGDVTGAVVDTSGFLAERWVPWQQVPDFYGSGPGDRHYVLDYLTGTLTFGDGQAGMIPPPGPNTIRATLYRTGGGTCGNRQATTIIQLKAAIPYVDGVTNYVPAAAGTDGESLARVKERGPKVLRHRNRAVTAQDFEDLAYEASPDVVRACAIVPHYDPRERRWLAPDNATDAGQVGLIIVPYSTAARPDPSLDLLDRVEAYIRARATPTLTLWVAGPDWLQVTVEAQIVPVSFAGADGLVETVTATLQRFLHPLFGGPGGDGWPFGRQPHESDLYACLESIAQVDYVRSLSVQKNPPAMQRPDRCLVYSGQHCISLMPPQQGA